MMIVMVSLMVRHYGNMLLSPYKDLNGHTKYNVIFQPIDRKLDVMSANNSWHKKRTMCVKLLLNNIS